MKKPAQITFRFISTGLFLCSLLAHNASAAVWYWDNNGLSAPTSGTWDTTTPQWSTTTALTATPSVWSSANAAGFPAGAAGISALAISVNSPISFAGSFNGLTATIGVTNLTISGTGSLSINANLQGFWTGSTYNTIVKVPLTGSGGLQNQSGGSLFLAVSNSYSGGTSFGTSAGLNINNGSAFGTGPITNSTGTIVLATPALDSAGVAFATAPMTITNTWQTFGGTHTEILVGLAAAPVTFSGPWVLTGAAGTTTTLDVRTTTWTISGPVSGAANLTKINTATLLLSGANTYSGKTIVGNGTVSVSSLNKVTGGSTSSSLGHPTTVGNGTIGLGTTTTAGTLLYAGAGETTDRVVDLAGTTGGAIVQNDGSGAIVFSSDFTASGAGAKTLTLQGANTAANTISGRVVDGTSSTALTKAGAGKWVLSGANTYSGNTTNTAGTLAQGAANVIPSGSGKGNFASSASATFDLGGFDCSLNGFSGTSAGTIDNTTGAGTYTLTIGNNNGAGTQSGAIKNTSGTVNVVKTGSGAVVFSGPNTYSGKTTINGGSIQIAADTGLGTAPGGFVADQLTLNGGTLRLNVTAASPVANRGITLGASGGTLDCTSGQSPIVNSVISGVGALTKISSGNVDLLGANTFQGGLTITGGGVRFRNDNAAGTGTITVTPASIVTLRNLNPPLSVNLANPVVLNANGGNDIDLAAATSATFTLSGNLSGTGYLTRDRGTAGNGTVSLTGSNSAWSGGLLWRGSATALGSSNALGTGTLVFTPANVDPVILSATTPLTGASAVTNVVQIAISNATQQITIGGANDLELSGPISLGGAPSTLSPVIITNNNSGSTIFSGPISGTGFGLTVAGTGKLTLNGNNTYNGGTVVASGKLLVSNSSGSGTGSGAVTVLSGATLGGGGDIAGTVTVNSGATLSPGASIGTLTLDVPPVLNGTNNMEINRNGGSPLADKLVVSSGTLTYGGILNVVNLGVALQSGDTFVLFSAGSYAGSFSSIIPLTPGAGLVWDASRLTVDGTIKVVCNGTLAASAGANTNICSGSGALIGGSPTGSGGSGSYTYSWSPATGLDDATLANPTASPTSTTTYTVTVTDSVGCSASANLTVGVDVAPTISSQPANSTVCSGTAAGFSVAASGSGLAYSWAQHSNAGWGSGNGWSASGTGGTFRQTSTQNENFTASCGSFSSAQDINSPSGNALGMYSGGGGGEIATRTFTALAAGQVVSIDVDNGNVDGGSEVGFSLQTSGGADVLQFYFLGGQANYKYNDGTEQDTGIGFQRTGLRVQFVLTSATTYKLIVTPCGGAAAIFTGAYSGTIAQLKLFNQNGSGGDANNLYFNNFIVGGYTDNADNYSGDFAGQNGGDQAIVAGNGGSNYTTPTLTVGDSGTQYEVVVSGCSGTFLSSAASVTVNPPALVNAGPDLTSCASSPAVTLGGWFGGAAPGAAWSGGTGSFNPDNTTSNAIYTPSAGEITAGTVTLTLTTGDPDGAGPCGPVNDTMTITINPAAVVNAGPDKTVCASSPATALGGYFGGAALGATWTGGAGLFSPDNTTTNAIYTPSAGEILAGTVTLTLTTDDPAGPCGSVNDAMVIAINPAATVNAGPDQTVCSDAPDTTLAGSIGGSAASATWSGGAGSFNPNNTTLTAIYTPSVGEIAAGTVTLTLTTDDPSGPCGAVNDSMVITIDKVTATNLSFVRSAGSSIKISKTNLVANASDTDSEIITFVGAGTDGVNLLTTNGVTLTTDTDWIFYTNSVTPNAPDSFSYKVTDARGCVALATVYVQVVTNGTGQGTTVTVSNGIATVGFAGIPGRSYQVQRSTNLADWATIGTTTAPGNGIFQWADDFNDLGVPPADPPSSAYYRLRLP